MKTPRDPYERRDASSTAFTPKDSTGPDVGVTQVDSGHDPAASAMRHRLSERELEQFRIGRFSVLEKLGEGGMGVVFAAYDGQLDRKVAVKLVLAASEGDPRRQRRLLDEARSMAKLEHPNVATVYEVGEHHGGVFVAMEFVAGETLRAYLRREPALPELIEAFRQAGEGLAAAHEAGLVHRDFKPDNVMRGEDGRVRVLDFGLAMPQVGQGPAESMALLRTDEFLDEKAGRKAGVAGTPAYMAPEVYTGEVSNPASDQFSFCVALWEGLYGQRPFEGGSITTLSSAAEAGEVRRLASVGRGGIKIPPWLRELVARGLSARPQDRWPSMRALLDALAAGDPRAAGRKRWLTIALVGALAAVVGGAKLRENQIERDHIDTCERLASELQWDDARAGALRDAIVATGAEGASDEARKAIETFETFSRRWRDLRTQTCLSEEIRRDIDPEVADHAKDCLARERISFEATMGALMEVDKGMVTRIDATLTAFDGVDKCGDEAHLELIPELPDDEATREAIRELELELERTMVDEHFGTFEKGLDASRRALARAEGLGYLPTVAKARYREAVFLEKLGKYDAAASAWARSFRESLLGGYEELASHAAMALAFTEGYQLARYDTGIRWAELAGVYLERIGHHDGLEEGKRLDVLAVLLEMRGDLEASAQTHERSLALRRATVDPRHHDIAYGLVNYSFVADKLGHSERAHEMLEEALSIFEEHYGRDNPTTSRVVHSLAQMERRMGLYESAEKRLERVRENWAQSLGEEHPDYADLLRSFGQLRRDQGRLTEAEPYLREALRIHRAGLAAGHPEVVTSIIELGEVLPELGKSEEAKALFLEAWRASAEDPGRRGQAAYGLGRLALASGQRDEARARFEAAKLDFGEDDAAWPDWMAKIDAGLAEVSSPARTEAE